MSDTAPAGAAGRRLWVHCVGSAVPALERSAERALVLAAGDDVVCVPRPIDPEHLGYLASLGLGPAAANVVVVPPARHGEDARPLAARLLTSEGGLACVAGRMGGHPFSIHPYAGTAEVFALARALERATGRTVPVQAALPDVTALAGRRDLARARATELGIPVLDGEVATLPPQGRRRRDLEPLRAALERQRRRTGRVIVRAAAAGRHDSRFVVGDGGEDVEEVLRRAALIVEHRTWLVEVLVEATVCCTVHLRVEPGTGAIRQLGVSERRPGRGLTAAGSRYPTTARAVAAMEEWAGAMGEWLRDLGYAGLAGIEFAEHRDPGTGQPCARFTGVVPRAREGSYALGIREALAAPAFVSGVLAARPQPFGRLRETLGTLLYDADRAAGVLPYATGCLERGRCPVVALGRDRLHASELLATAQGRLDGQPAAAGGG